MQQADSVEGNALAVDELVDILPPYIRHLVSIQIRNLSPLPAYDTLASTSTRFTKPVSETVGSSPVSILTLDDADILVGRRTKRRVSSSSLGTLHSTYDEHGNKVPSGQDFPDSRKGAGSKTSIYASGGSPSSQRKLAHADSVESSSAIRLRARRTSQTSIRSSHSGNVWFPDEMNTQEQLEHAIWSRLIETFLTISVPESNKYTRCGSPRLDSGTKTHVKKKKETGAMKKPFASIDRQSSCSSLKPPTRSSISIAPTKARRGTSLPVNDATGFAVESHNLDHGVKLPNSPPPTPSPSFFDVNDVPAFISSFHRPSTNPKFPIDPSGAFAPWADVAADFMVVRLWGCVGAEWDHGTLDAKWKGKAKQSAKSSGNLGSGWSILDSWDIKLSDLVPLPDNLHHQPWTLPVNTIVISFSTSNYAYYLPSSLLGRSSDCSRPHSPEYSSDPEAARMHDNNIKLRGFPGGRRRGRVDSELKSAHFNELLRLVALQASRLDAQILLQEVVDSCDKLIASDRIGELRREASERDYCLRRLQERKDILDDDIRSARDNLSLRRDQIRQRSSRLAEARILHEDYLLSETDTGAQIAEEKKKVRMLKEHVMHVQTTLLSTLSYIFPIELLSPPDLLYTILSAPLPIPLQGNDPAPPLSLPGNSSVNEDSVASAMGYAALLVQLIAVYLSRILIYPITYIGSRSLIKDPISAMVGPRMFPLYSKGVDTYRFEYGVFLLNKNIEMIMADYNLRALDLRHTIPNLKNLLLTLTSGESAVPRFRPPPSPSLVSISSGLQTPDSRPAEGANPPPLALNDSSVTPKLSPTRLPPSEPGIDADDGGDDAATVVADSAGAGSSTSTSATTSRPRMPRIQIHAYLGFAPLTSMWRMRQSSTSDAGKISSRAGAEDSSTESSKGTTDSVEGAAASAFVEEDVAEEDEEDRRTVKGVSTPVDPTCEAIQDGLRIDDVGAEIVRDANENGNRVVSVNGSGEDGLETDLEKHGAGEMRYCGRKTEAPARAVLTPAT